MSWYSLLQLLEFARQRASEANAEARQLLDTSISTLRAENFELSRLLELSQQDLYRSQSEKTMLESSMLDVSAEKAQAAADLLAAKQQLADHEIANASLQRLLEVSSADKVNLNGSLAAVQAELGASEKSRAELQTSLSALQLEVAELSISLEESRQDLEESAGTRSRLESRLEALRMEHESVCQQLDASQHELSASEDARAELEQSMHELKQQSIVHSRFEGQREEEVDDIGGGGGGGGEDDGEDYDMQSREDLEDLEDLGDDDRTVMESSFEAFPSEVNSCSNESVSVLDDLPGDSHRWDSSEVYSSNSSQVNDDASSSHLSPGLASWDGTGERKGSDLSTVDRERTSELEAQLIAVHADRDRLEELVSALMDKERCIVTHGGMRSLSFFMVDPVMHQSIVFVRQYLG